MIQSLGAAFRESLRCQYSTCPRHVAVVDTSFIINEREGVSHDNDGVLWSTTFDGDCLLDVRFSK